MRWPAARRPWLAVVSILFVAGCGAASSGYPLSAEAPAAAVRSRGTVGVPTQAVVAYLEVRPGDRIELVGAEAIGTLGGAPVATRLSRPVIEDNGDHVIGTAMEPVEGPC